MACKIDTGLEKEYPSVSLKLLGDPRYKRLASEAPAPMVLVTLVLPPMASIAMVSRMALASAAPAKVLVLPIAPVLAPMALISMAPQMALPSAAPVLPPTALPSLAPVQFHFQLPLWHQYLWHH